MSVLRMIAVIGAPQVLPSTRPDMNSGISASLRWVAYAAPPGARRFKKRCSASISTAIPAGKPSITTPMAGACDCPKMVSLQVSAVGVHRCFLPGVAAQRAEIVKKPGIGFVYRVGLFDRHFAIAQRGRDGRHHHDAVVVLRGYEAAGKLVTAVDQSPSVVSAICAPNACSVSRITPRRSLSFSRRRDA